LDIQQTRLKRLNNAPPTGGDYVLYWMQQAQRAEENYALEYAVCEANSRGLPLYVFFGLTESFPEANLRHYVFMLQGLAEVYESLKQRGIPFIIQKCEPDKGVVKTARSAAVVVTDRGYLRIQRRWRLAAAAALSCPLVQVETEVIVPVETASPKEEYTAGTFRPKISKLLPFYLEPIVHSNLKIQSQTTPFDSLMINPPDNLIVGTMTDDGTGPVPFIKGGTSQAKALLQLFIDEKLDSLEENRNDPSKNGCSSMSPYLHFGQISSLYIALEVEAAVSPGGSLYLEELIVRRELSMNFTYYNPNYDSIECLPGWAARSLGEHGSDPRSYIYSLSDLETARTHDPYWNAAQTELTATGSMHGYMRMYWGKKILEWTRTAGEAFSRAVYLNNKYALDGRDPNSYAGIAWCFGKHDRAWKEREIFGKIRYMNARGLERKFDIKAYVQKVTSDHVQN
jgi:deoxyribodipyrimidine photo-lyase